VRIEWDGRTAILFFTSDVTRRVVMERDLLAAKSQAEEASRAKSAFLASMSHEIRTPLSAVIGMVDLAMAGEQDPARRDCLVTASDSARHLLTIVTDLLDFSKIEAGKLVPERVHFDLHEAVESAVRTFSFQARQHGLELVVDIDPAAPRFVLGDPGRLRQVLVNLVGNALKFTDQGFVRVEVRPVDPGRAGVVAARILVKDSGIGIPPDKIDSVFEQFTQAEGSISRRYGGTGLGLAICRRLVDLMGGSIGVESVEGQGSTFFFNLVLEPGDQRLTPETSEAEADGPETGGKLKILLVEDNPVNVKVASLHLAQLGHEMIAASDGAEALKLLSRERFDAVLMDLEMPGMDGLEVTRRIRSADPRHGKPLDPLVPIVAMTAHALAELRDRCLEAGMDGYLSKPVDLEELGRALRLACTGI
jgi:CheY-like chemotaxis protein